jgi:hypothetical protein
MSLRDRLASRQARKRGDQPAEGDGGSRPYEDDEEQGRLRESGRGSRTSNDKGLRDSNDKIPDDESQDKRKAPTERPRGPLRKSRQGSNTDDKPSDSENETGDGLEEKPRALRDRGSKNTPLTEEDEEPDKPAPAKEKNPHEKEIENGPLRILEPLRTDPLGPMKSRLKHFERLAAQSIPEVHFIGSIMHGEDMLQDTSDGCCCRYSLISSCRR